MAERRWYRADQISDAIVDLINSELKKPGGCDPLDMLAGQMLALMALCKTADGIPKPVAFVRVQNAITECLQSMLYKTEEWQKQ